MVQIFTKSLGASLLLASIATAMEPRGCTSRTLTYPEVIDLDELNAADEILTLDLEWKEVDPGFGDDSGDDNDINGTRCGSTPFMTRALGGSVPGPTLTVSRGTTITVKFKNKLTYQPESFSSRPIFEMEDGGFLTQPVVDRWRLNKFNDPDVANLHFHGLHISGVLPSDDTTLEVLPQQEYTYVINIPEYHEPGLHWVHPHHHGSSTLQLVGGAALAIIVKDPKEEENSILPAQISEAPERVMVFQDWDFIEAIQTARHANDVLLMESFSSVKGGESIGQRFVTVNGKYQPITEMTVGKWERWRFLYAGWQDLPLQFGFTAEGNEAECEFHMLAKDGIYLSDYPRGPMLTPGGTPLPIPPGGRADFMVRCNKAGATSRFEALSRKNILSVNCVEDESDMATTESTTEGESSAIPAVAQQRSIDSLNPLNRSSIDLPEYLKSVKNDTASSGCTCGTKFEGYDDTSRVNNQIYFSGNNYMHTSYLGAVVERTLRGMEEHSYHQHVYPYQLIDFPNQDSKEGNEYFKVGDWHDTYLDKKQKGGPVTIRYRTTDIPGKIMVHCHNTLHADSGMIQKEYVRNVENAFCMCDIFGAIDGDGIVDDIDNPKIIGELFLGTDAPSPEASSGFSFGISQLLPLVMVVVVGALL